MDMKDEILKIAADSYKRGSVDSLECLLGGLIKAVESANEDPPSDHTDIPYGFVKGVIADAIDAIKAAKQ